MVWFVYDWILFVTLCIVVMVLFVVVSVNGWVTNVCVILNRDRNRKRDMFRIRNRSRDRFKIRSRLKKDVVVVLCFCGVLRKWNWN